MYVKESSFRLAGKQRIRLFPELGILERSVYSLCGISRFLWRAKVHQAFYD